jgi:anti-sigma B factor antagonist
MASTQVTLDTSGDVAVITAIGEIDIATAPMLLHRFSEVPQEVHKMVIDLSGVTYLDSSGLGVLVAFEKRLQVVSPAVGIHVVVSQPEILKLFEITGLGETFPIALTLEKAMASL